MSNQIRFDTINEKKCFISSLLTDWKYDLFFWDSCRVTIKSVTKNKQLKLKELYISGKNEYE